MDFDLTTFEIIPKKGRNYNYIGVKPNEIRLTMTGIIFGSAIVSKFKNPNNPDKITVCIFYSAIYKAFLIKDASAVVGNGFTFPVRPNGYAYSNSIPIAVKTAKPPRGSYFSSNNPEVYVYDEEYSKTLANIPKIAINNNYEQEPSPTVGDIVCWSSDARSMHGRGRGIFTGKLERIWERPEEDGTITDMARIKPISKEYISMAGDKPVIAKLKNIIVREKQNA